MSVGLGVKKKKFFDTERKLIYQLWRMLGIHCCCTCRFFREETRCCIYPGEQLLSLGAWLDFHREKGGERNVGSRCEDWE